MSDLTPENYVDRLLKIGESNDLFNEEADEIIEKLVEIGEPAIEPLIYRYLCNEEILYGDEFSIEVIDALGEIGEKAINALIIALDGEIDVLKHNAARALGRIGNERAIEPLTRSIYEDKAYSAVYALGDIGGEKVAQVLIQVLQDKVFDDTQSVIGWLGKTKSDSVYPILINALQDIEPEMRRSAVYALRDLQQERIVEPLVSILDDPVDNVRSAAAYILAEDYHDIRAVPILAQDLHCRVGGVRAGVAKAIAKTRDIRFISNLYDLMKNDAQIYTRLSCAVALIELEDKYVQEAETFIKATILSEDDWTRFALIQALRGSNHPQSLQWLLQMLKDNNVGIRHYSAQYIGEYGSKIAIEALQAQGEIEEHRVVRKAIQKALETIEQV